LYLSEFSGLEDKDENYSIITFELSVDNKTTKLMVTQKGFVDKEFCGNSIYVDLFLKNIR
jgi:hypothetical protein